MTTREKVLGRIDCPSCSGTGFEAPDYMGLYPCEACLGHEAKRPATSIDELREWALDGCPEGVSGMPQAVLAAIEAHEADKKAFSDALRDYFGCQISDVAQGFLGRFILPEPDPLVEALGNVSDEDIRRIADSRDVAVCRSRIADALRGYKIESIEQ